MGEIIKKTTTEIVYNIEKLLLEKEGAELRIAEANVLIAELKETSYQKNIQFVIDEKIIDYEIRIEADMSEINNINEILA